MLNWISSRLKSGDSTSTHPLASDDGISAWLADIPTIRPQIALQTLEEWLHDPEQIARDLSPTQMARAIGRLDEFAQPLLQQCWQEVREEARKERRGLLPLRPLESYYQHIFTTNLLLVQRLALDPAQGQDKKQLALFASRTMHAWVQQKKLARLGYRAPVEHWWSQAHEIVRSCRTLGILNHEVQRYRDEHQQSSVWLEYLASLLLETLPLSNLTANEIDAADRLTRWIATRTLFQDSRSGQTLFQIDPEGNRGPERIQLEPPGGMRFFGPGPGLAQLSQLRASFAGNAEMPPWLATVGLGREQLRTLLQTVIAHWSAEPPSRQQPRATGSGRIQVVNGLALVRRMVAASEFARSGRTLDYEGYIKSLQQRHKGHEAIVQDVPPPPRTPMEVLHLLETAGDRQMMDHWEIIDLSEHGMGARCFTRRPWHAIGALIAWRRPDDLDWRVAVVRRLGSSHGVPNAGLITFSAVPYCSQVRISQEAGGSNLWGGQTQETSGLGWRDAVMVSFEERLLLAPPDTYEENRLIEVSIRGRFRPARIVGLEAKGNDYELLRFKEAGVTRSG